MVEKYNVAKSTIFAIRNKIKEINKAVSSTFSGPGERKTLRQSELPRMEIRLYKWLLSQRIKNVPLSGLIIKEKAKYFHNLMNETSSQFHASEGWSRKFKKRYGIRLIAITGEKLSCQPELINPFKRILHEKIQAMDLSEEQIYNADESALFYKLLPTKSFVAADETCTPGRKPNKERVTFMVCSNAAGTHKFKPLVIGRSKSPRCFKNFVLPVKYASSKNAWMTSFIFKNWFFENFVSEVSKRFLIDCKC